MLPKVCVVASKLLPETCAYVGISDDEAPTPYNGGTITTLGQVITEALPVRIAFGFQRVNEDWGEASWTAGDLR